MATLRIAALLLVGIVVALLVTAQTPAVSFTATSENVSGAPEAIRIDVLRWSTDAERDQLLAAWNLTAPAGGGRGKGGKGAAKAPDPTPDPSAVDLGDGNAGPARGGGKAKGKGGGKGGGAPAVVLTPEASLKAALEKAPTVGRLWSSEVAGYSVRYAVRLPGQDGGERIILITDRRLGAWNDSWKPVGGATPTTYEFSIVELRVNAKGEGDGKVSLVGKVAVDSSAKTLALEDFNGSPVMLKNVRRK